MSEDEPSYYEILGIRQDAGASDIEAAYHQLAKSTHPDVGGNAGLFRVLRLAYTTLRDPATRRVYDAGLRSSGGIATPSTSPPPPPVEDPLPMVFEALSVRLAGQTTTTDVLNVCASALFNHLTLTDGHHVWEAPEFGKDPETGGDFLMMYAGYNTGEPYQEHMVTLKVPVVPPMDGIEANGWAFVPYFIDSAAWSAGARGLLGPTMRVLEDAIRSLMAQPQQRPTPMFELFLGDWGDDPVAYGSARVGSMNHLRQM
ncbi:MAG: J domain-containing protein [Acidimicrobiales bacterium]